MYYFKCPKNMLNIRQRSYAQFLMNSYQSKIIYREPQYLSQPHQERRRRFGGDFFLPIQQSPLNHIMARHCDVKGFAICGYCISDGLEHIIKTKEEKAHC